MQSSHGGKLAAIMVALAPSFKTGFFCWITDRLALLDTGFSFKQDFWEAGYNFPGPARIFRSFVFSFFVLGPFVGPEFFGQFCLDRGRLCRSPVRYSPGQDISECSLVGQIFLTSLFSAIFFGIWSEFCRRS